MDENSKDKVIELIENRLLNENFNHFIKAVNYSLHDLRRSEHTIFSCHRITHVIDGNFELMLGSGKKYDLRRIDKGTTLLMQPFCITDTLPDKHCGSIAGIVCHSGFMRIFYADSMKNGSFNQAERFFYHLSDSRRQCTANAIKTICSLDEDILDSDYASTLMQLIWKLILQDLKSSSVNELGKAHNLWFQIRDFISMHPSEMISRKMLAAHFNVTETYISILFSKFSGTSFKGYLMQEKLNKAIELLDQTDMTVNEAAFYSGFDSVSYFIRVFKSVYEMSPGAWRRIKK
jgi:AraC-like DNA-binding protein